MIEIRPPVPQFPDTDGSPLDDGYIYIGVAGANPETSPRAVYWDKAGTIAATQPIRTLNGYPSRDGAIAKFYTATRNYSITVRDKRSVLVASVLNADSGVFDELTDTASAAGVGYSNTTSGLAATNVQAAIDALEDEIDAVNTEVDNISVSTSGIVNLFANAAFMINQRGYASGTVTGSANQYTVDRIRVVVSGESLIITASTFGNRITAPAGGAEQVIEGNRVAGGTYVCNWTGSGTIQVNGVARVKNEEFTLTAGSNATIRMFGDFERFQLTRPNQTAQFEYDYAADLALCRRYRRSGVAFLRAYGIGAQSIGTRVEFPPMRIAPTIVPTWTYTNASGGTVSNITNTGADFEAVVTATNGAIMRAEFTADAEI